jgi:CDGSH-type Zn-finger protein/truncated hemoglobin YjbI
MTPEALVSDADSQQLLLLRAAEALQSDLAGANGPEAQRASARLRDSVVRPLREVVSEVPTADGPVSGGEEVSSMLDLRVWQLARAATELLVRLGNAPELAEATAALQDLAVGLAEESEAAKRLAELQALQAELEQRIQVAHNGPYLVSNARNLYDWLGEPLPVRPTMALCRCGASSIKPLCDGAHAAIGFSDAKDPKRVQDRQDTYVGQQVTILDNRGTCQHSGYCSDRLATVFRVNQEPFVAPSGGRMDEIIRAVRDCPSGALSYAIDGVEAREHVDYHGTREPAIEVTKDGPYRITGSIPLVDHAGEDVARNQGASREHFALCRCGHSQNKPFCSGMHWYVEFHDPVPDPDRTPTIFEWAGGMPALIRMTRLFYEKHVPQDPLLAPLFANMSADHPQRVAKWLAEVFCGPRHYSAEHGGYTRMISQHAGKGIAEEQRTRWVALLVQSAREAGLPDDPEFRSAFSSYIEWGSRLAVENSQTDSRPPPHMPMPRWDWNTAAGPPGSRVSALAPPAEQVEEEVAPPAAGESVGFERHVKPLFRERDRKSMNFALDLWSYDDVKTYADAILQRLQNGSMPCDGAWPEDKVDVFQRWIQGGKLS